MMGALRSTATDVMEMHADLLPFDLLVDRICHRGVVRACNLPNTHPLSAHVRNAGKRFVKTHRSSLHELLDACKPHLDYAHTKHIKPARLHPRWKPRHRVHVDHGRPDAVADHPKWKSRGAAGSTRRGRTMMAALYVPGRCRPRILRYHLGPSTEHTVYEAEVVGALLALQLIRTGRRPGARISIRMDNVAVIQASTLRTSASGRYLTDLFHKRVRDLHRLTPGLKLTLRWTPGHEGIEGKERADEEAKLAAKGQTGPAAELTRELKRKLQASAFSLRRNFKAHLKTLATARWKASERGKRMADITEALLSSRTLSSPPPRPRRHAGIVMQLRTGHIPLQGYLARIGKVLLGPCPTCGEAPETVYHFLVECDTYSLHRAVHFAPLGRSDRTLKRLLTSDRALRPLLQFVNATGRLRHVFGALCAIPQEED